MNRHGNIYLMHIDWQEFYEFYTVSNNCTKEELEKEIGDNISKYVSHA